MHTPTRTPYGRVSSNGSVSGPSTAMRTSSFTTQRNTSSGKSDYSDSFFTSPNLQTRNSSNVSSSSSRTVSRTNSKNYFQQPPQITSSPHRKSISRSTSRSSSRLSLSSMASTSAGSVSKGSTLFHDSTTSLDLGMNTSRIQVTVRPRPFSPHEDTFSPWNIDFNNAHINHPELGGFNYDYIFSSDDDNRRVFEVSAIPAIEKCLEGFNATIFAYGMTGSGKTYSMEGVLKESIYMLFNNTDKYTEILHSPMSDKMDHDGRNWGTNDVFNDDTIIVGMKPKVRHITCSILEIYNEKLKDLLSDNRGGHVRDLRIVDDKKFGIQVYGLTEVTVTSPVQLLEFIEQGESLRSIDSTDYNYTSSRSHFIVMLKVFLENPDGSEIVSLLNFCDLAGSERATSHADRRVEGGYINKSLLALGTVITKLSESTSNNTSVHIPYRDSKLTRLLQPSLSGGSMVSILCTIHMGSNVIGETVNTLRFGSRAKNVVLNVRRNTEELDIGKIAHENELLRMEIFELRGLLEMKQSVEREESVETVHKRIGNDNTGINDDLYYEIVAENNILNEQVEHLKRLQLEQNIYSSQQTNEDLNNLNDLLNSLILDSATRRRGEEILFSLNNSIREYKHKFDETESYVGHLENRLRLSEAEATRKASTATQQIPSPITPNYQPSSLDRTSSSGLSQMVSDEVISDLKEEVGDLKRSLARKDAMIRALQKAVHDR